LADSARYASHRPEIRDNLERGEAKIRELAAQNVRTLKAGSVLIDAESDHQYVYRLRSGWAGRVREIEDGRSAFILIFMPRDLFAVKSMFVDRHPDEVRTLSDIEVEQIDQRVLREAFCDPDIALRCAWQIEEEERRLHSWIVGLGRGGADERIALMLVDFRGRLAESKAQAKELVEFAVPMTQEQIGDFVGISPVHVNRVLKTFREAGIATLKGGKCRILDPDALARVARPLLDPHDRAEAEGEY
jgi:CRP/FNR family transcriptional regulator, anaerobic regulatory protein